MSSERLCPRMLVSSNKHCACYLRSLFQRRRCEIGGSNLFWRASSLEITAESQVQIHAFAEAGGTNLCELNFRGEVFSSETQDGEHVDLALFELQPSELHRIGAARNCVAQRAFAFAQIIIAGESIFDVLERVQRGAHVTCGGGFLLGGAEILRRLEFTPKENRLRDPTGETPDEGIERADSLEFRSSEPTPGA